MGELYINSPSSFKEGELNRILDKISFGNILTDSENRFLSNIDKYTDDLYKDYLYLSKNDVFNRVSILLESKIIVICDLYDKDGKIGLEIVSIHNNFEEDYCFVVLENQERFKIKDNFSYNVIYDVKKDEYSLQVQDEFFDKIPVKNE
jgi:hypothetical protein